jgi:hypothetical protein
MEGGMAIEQESITDQNSMEKGCMLITGGVNHVESV